MRSHGQRLHLHGLGLWVPLVLVVALLGDLASRFISYDRVSFRAWEAVSRGRPIGFGGSFAANRRYSSDHAYGDLAAMGNYPALRQYRREVFTTDDFGMRNQSSAPAKPWAAILAGTSFSVGSGVSDDSTLSAQIGAILDAPVYNAAGPEIGDEHQIRILLDRLGLKRGVLILDITDGAPLPSAASLRPEDEGDLHSRWETRLGRHAGAIYKLRNALTAWLAQSPLKVTLFQAFKRVQNDMILPNRFAKLVIRDELSNGDPVLLGSFQVSARPQPSIADDATAYCRGLARMLSQHHIDLLVVLIPSQSRIYGPLLKHPRERLGVDLLLKMEADLNSEGIAVVNLTSVLAAAAREGLPTHHYVYHRDDTHWNAQGIALAARTIAPKVKAIIAEQAATTRSKGVSAP